MRIRHAAFHVVGEMRRNFKADIAVAPLRCIIHRPQHIRRHANILERKRFEQILVAQLPVRPQQLAHGKIVAFAVRHRLLENGGVAGNAAQLVFIHHTLQFAVIDEIAADRVQPDGLAALQQLFKRIHIVPLMAAPLSFTARVRLYRWRHVSTSFTSSQ